MDNDTQPVEKQRVDTYFEKQPADNKPHKIIIGNDAYTTFDDATVDGVAEGDVVSFEYVVNGRFNNIVDGSLEIIEAGRDDGGPVATPTGIQIRRQVALKAAVEFHKQEPVNPEEVTTTAATFNEWLQKADEV
jgi:hypothetical protein